MKNSFLGIAGVFCILLPMLLSCSSHDAAEDALDSGAEEVRVRFVYTLDTSTGTPMRRVPKTNSEVFDEFYPQIQSGELVAPSYELTLTDAATGTTYNFSGQWAGGDFVTLPTGTYHIIGRSTADGECVQDRCSFTFDETVDITAGSTSVVLHADYDCFLLIFGNSGLQSLICNDGQSNHPFYTFGNYRYAFVRDRLYVDGHQAEACIDGTYTSGGDFRIYTGNLRFEVGKYYVYNGITGGFDVPPMEEGSMGDGDGTDDDTPQNDEPNQPAEDIAIDMVSLPAGQFQMGSASDDADATDDERPQHLVTVAAFSIGRYEVTQQLWQQVMGSNPAYFQGAKVKTDDSARPVEMVSKQDVDQFLTRLNQKTGRHYRLPTEEEWEYAARGGQNGTWKYAGADQVDDVAWYKTNAGSVTHAVGDPTKRPNDLGICDMSGNVLEWTSTLWTADYSSSPTGTTDYVVRGGSYSQNATACRVACRNFYAASSRRNNLGFRLAMDATAP